jgi:putative peptide zinc metalloprotease protein
VPAALVCAKTFGEEINVTVVETRVSVWEALAGRAPGQPIGPADPGLWSAVAERLNPVRARPRLRPDVEVSHLVSARAVPYVMLRSPDVRSACYLRLAPEELELAELMDGTRTVARLVAEFARISGRLAPDQVTRVVADLAGNRMLEELPVDAFRPISRTRREPWPIRLGRGILAAVRGRRVILASIDPLVTLPLQGGGRLLFTRVAAVLSAIVALAGIGLFCWTWANGDQSAFLINDSYPLARSSCSASTCSRWPATSWATRSRPSTPAGGCRRPGSSCTSGSRRCSSTPPTCGWPGGGPGCAPPPPGRRPG